MYSDSEKRRLLGRSRRIEVVPCVVAAVIASQLSLISGMSQGFSTILLQQLKNPDSSFHVNADEASWIASLGTIFRPIGALVEGVLVDKFGRKKTMQLTALLIAFSWLMTYFSNTLVLLYISRALLSFGLGMVICVGLYIAEIAKPMERGTLLSLITPFTMLGTLCVYILGDLLSWQTVALSVFAYCLILFAVMFYIPESHIWCMLNNKRLHAFKALVWLRCGNIAGVETEIENIELRLQNKEPEANYWDNFFDPAVWKPFLILVIFSIFQQQAGYNIITYYSVQFFSSIGLEYDGNKLSIAFAAISTLGSILLMTIVHKYNRITLLVASGLGMTVSMVIGALFLSFPIFVNLHIVSVSSVYVYILCCMLGMIDIPWMVIGEMFPSRVRGTMSANVTVVIFFLTFINVKMYSMLDSSLGIDGLFWYFALFSFLAVIFAKVYFPETRNKSLFDVEDQFRRK